MSEEMTADDSPELEVEVQESDAPEIEQEETLYDDADDYVDDDAAEEEAPEEDDDSEELTFNDKAYKLPKDIAEGVKSMQKDYTQKTMQIADMKRDYQQQVQFHQQFREAIKEVDVIDATLQQFQQLDWKQLDPETMHRFLGEQQNLMNLKQQKVAELAQKKEQLQLEHQQHTAKMIESSEAVLKRDIKEWNATTETAVQTFATDKLGFDLGEVKISKTDPRLYKALYYAWKGHQALSKTAAVTKQPPKIVQKAQPVTTLKAKTTSKVQRDPTQMNDAEFAKWRQQYRQKR